MNDNKYKVFPTFKKMINASIDGIHVNHDHYHNHLITFIRITNERDDVFMIEVGNQLKLG